MLRVLAHPFFYLFILLMTQTSCQRSTKPNIVILAFDSLSTFDLQCSESLMEKENSGFAEMCKNSVRFTHYYTTSTQPLAAFSSLMTGFYPFDLSVHDSNSYVSSEIITLNEVAERASYKTFLISSSPFILRKNNIHQGVQQFEDFIPVSTERIHRSFTETSAQLKGWLNDESQAQPFFATLYISDFNFIKKKSLEFDQIENKLTSSDEQTEEIDNQLFQFFEFLKSKKSWHNTMIVIVGLNGQPQSDRKLKHNYQNLHSENIQTTLLIKPLSKERDQPINWKLDYNTNTLDLYATLREVITRSSSSEDINPFIDRPRMAKPESLTKYLDIEKSRLSLTANNQMKHRVFISESFFENRFNYGLIQDYSLYMQNEQRNWIFYNSLIDRAEVLPQKINSESQLNKDLLNTIEFVRKYIDNAEPILSSSFQPLIKASELHFISCEIVFKQKEQIRENLKNCNDPLIENIIRYLYAEDLKSDKDELKKAMLIKLNQLKQLLLIKKYKNQSDIIFTSRPIDPLQIEMIKKIYRATEDPFLKNELKPIALNN